MTKDQSGRAPEMDDQGVLDFYSTIADPLWRIIRCVLANPKLFDIEPGNDTVERAAEFLEQEINWRNAVASGESAAEGKIAYPSTERLELEPGDILVVRYPSDISLTGYAHDMMMAKLNEFMPAGVRALILDSGAELSVIEQKGAPGNA